MSVYRTIGPLVLISLALFVYPNTLSYQTQTVLCCYTFDIIFHFDTEMLSEGGIKKNCICTFISIWNLEAFWKLR